MEDTKRVGRIDTEIVSLLMTDVVGSTRKWQADPPAMALAVAALDDLVGTAVRNHGGQVVGERGEGDSHFCVFRAPAECLLAAVEIQRALGRDDFKVRAAVHTGEVQPRQGDFYGPVINRCARIRELAYGGQILVSSSTQQMAEWSSGEIKLKSLGHHRLRDLDQPEHIFQVAASGLVETFPPLKSLSRRPNNLPVQLSSFIGRESEIVALSDLVRSHRLVTVTGSGGSGKTRLSLQAGASLVDDFPEGVWFVDLSVVENAEGIGDAIAVALSIPTTGDLLARMCEHLADGRQLLIVDNCEHLWGACRETIARTLRECATLSVLATSRQRLEAVGEYVYRCPGLSLPQGDEVDAIATSDAVSLLLERAASQGGELTMTPSVALSVASLCRRLDGLPLPIELVAASLNLLSPDEVSERLGEFLARSTSSIPGADRQKTMTAVLKWSLSLLDPQISELLSRLSIFPASCSREAVEAICGAGRLNDSRILAGLNVLVNQSLIMADRRATGRMRFRMLVSTREVLRLNFRVGTTLRKRFVDYYLALAANAEALVASGAEDFEEDYPNVLFAMETAKTMGNAAWQEAAVQMRFFWIKSGRYREGLMWLREAANELVDPLTLRARAYNGIGALCLRMEDQKGALVALREAERLLGPLGGLDAIKVRLNVAILEAKTGDYDTAERLLSSCEEACIALGEDGWLSSVLINLGVARLVRGFADEETLQLFVRAAASAKAAGFVSSEATALENAAEIQLLRNEPIAALTYVAQSFELGETSEVFELAGTLRMLAAVFARLGQSSRAAEMLSAGEWMAEKYALVFEPSQQALHREALDWLGSYPEALKKARRALKKKTKAELFGLASETVSAALREHASGDPA